MKCVKCGARNDKIIYEAVIFPLDILPLPEFPKPINSSVTKRWACQECGRYHFPDGILYSVEEAKRICK